MFVPSLRALFLLSAAFMVYLALTPGPWGMVIENGEDRHLIAFSLLPLLSGIAWPRIASAAQFAGYALLGAAIELAQDAMGMGRKAEWNDFALDCIAAAVALTIVAALRLSTRSSQDVVG